MATPDILKFCIDYLDFKEKNYDDDYYLGILVKSIKISYKIDNKTLIKIDGISIILMDDGFIGNDDIQSNCRGNSAKQP